MADHGRAEVQAAVHLEDPAVVLGARLECAVERGQRIGMVVEVDATRPCPGPEVAAVG